jgi:hypothetical protein
MLEWLPHVAATAPDHTIESFKAAVNDPALDRQIDAIEDKLFASTGETRRWFPRRLLRHLHAARRNLQPQARPRDVSGLPQQLNPSGASVAPQSWRKPAR